MFPQRTDGQHDFRIWNSQLIKYAGYQTDLLPFGYTSGSSMIVGLYIIAVCRCRRLQTVLSVLKGCSDCVSWDEHRIVLMITCADHRYKSTVPGWDADVMGSINSSLEVQIFMVSMSDQLQQQQKGLECRNFRITIRFNEAGLEGKRSHSSKGLWGSLPGTMSGSRSSCTTLDTERD